MCIASLDSHMLSEVGTWENETAKKNPETKEDEKLGQRRIKTDDS